MLHARHAHMFQAVLPVIAAINLWPHTVISFLHSTRIAMPFVSLCFCPVLPECSIGVHDSLCSAEADNMYDNMSHACLQTPKCC